MPTDGDLFQFDDYEQYLQVKPIDEPITIYAPKPLKFTGEVVDGKLIVKHLEPPMFTAQWVGGIHGVENVKWENGPPSDFMELPRLMRKLGAFIASNFSQYI